MQWSHYGLPAEQHPSLNTMNALNAAGRDFWSSVPTDLLLAELSKRDDAPDDPTPTEPSQPLCGSGKQGAYDTPLHVFALILILALSTFACSFPLLSRRGPGSSGRRQGNIVFLCQHFGTGVLIATAFVHLLPTAFTSLTDPCLPYAFSKGYKPLAGLIAMVSALIVVAVESYLTTRGAGHSHSHSHMWDGDQDEHVNGHADEGQDGDNGGHAEYGNLLAVENNAERGGASVSKFQPSARISSRRGFGARPATIRLEDLEVSEGLIAGASPLPESSPAASRENGKGPGVGSGGEDPDKEREGESLDLDLHLDELQPGGSASNDNLPCQPKPPTQRTATPKLAPDRLLTPPSAPQPPAKDEQKRLLIQCLLLEAGILFHSIFIGMALSVATGSTFVVFLIAIAFHQSFEGLALGSRIAAVQFPRASLRPWVMVLAYGTTTPIGQAIGLVVHNMYDPQSQTGLLMVGFMNAISSGLLLFAGLVQLLAEDFLTDKSYRTLRGRRRVNAFLAVAAGAGLMATVGAFA